MLTPDTRDYLVDAMEALGRREYRDQIAQPSILFERIANNASEFVVFGRGPLGYLAVSGLQEAGHPPLAILDNNSSFWGSKFECVPVLSPAEGVSDYNDRAVFVVAIYHGSSPRQQLAALGCKRVASYAALFWRFAEHIPRNGLELPARILDDSAQFQKAYRLLSDESSRREFAAQIFWRCSLDDSRLPQHDSASQIYFPHDLVRLREDEVFMDCGAFDGDSIRLFLQRAGQQYRRIIALEPDPDNREALTRFAQAPDKPLRDISIVPYAVSDHSGKVTFNAKGSAGSSLATGGRGISIECRRIDDLGDLEAPTFIKMDIEGAEPDALEGAKETIRNGRPILAVCAYHKCQHLWQIPLIMKSILPEYHVHLRRYAEDCWETVYYAIPPERTIT
jgi:FkbM family methyltransferase